MDLSEMAKMRDNDSNAQSFFSTFVDTCESIRLTSSKNKKVDIISQYISHLQEESLATAVLFLSGKIFQRGSPYNLNIGFKTILQSLLEISNLKDADIKRIHLEHGDMGAIAEYAVSKKQVVTLFDQFEGKGEREGKQLTLSDMSTQFKKISKLKGQHSNKDKKNILKGLLIRCSPLEAKYLVKIISNEMRMGSYEGLVELAIAKAFGRDGRDVREAMLVSGDVANVALLSKTNTLNSATIEPFVPMSFMLADVMFTAKEIIEYFEKPLACEYKYDGIRVQMHKFGHKCKIYSRNLADISHAFPELVDNALQVRISKEERHQIKEIKNSNEDDELDVVDFILDGELIAFKNNKPLHFQELQKRLRRKNTTKGTLTEIPIRYVVYDIMFWRKKQVIKETLENRKKLLSKFLYKDSIMINAESDTVTTAGEVISKFKTSKESGHEGLVIKDPSSQYHPGKRGRHWIKLKEELDTIDTVIVMAEYGHGKRAGSLSDYTIAVRDFPPESDVDTTGAEDEGSLFNNLKIIGKAYSGLSDKEINYITSKLKSLVIRDEGNRIIVKPEIVLEVSFDTIQTSNRHDGGYALRFPRIKNIRYDKGLKDIDTLEKIRVIYENQFHIKNKHG
jgi:DNA ligase-1